MGGGPFPVRRLGRRLLWTRPSLYRWFGILRDRGDCLEEDFEVWIGGYPRSANTFAVAAFKLANPQVRIASHWHIPTFVIHGLRCGKPGILVIRRPLDSVVSWTLYWQGKMKLEDSLDYYLDFHNALLPYRGELFVAPFDATTKDFARILHQFNQRFGTKYTPLPPGENSVRRCVSFVEDWLRAPDGSINEFKVSRPSPKREALKPKLVKALNESLRLANKLQAANELYGLFCACLPPMTDAASAGHALSSRTHPCPSA